MSFFQKAATIAALTFSLAGLALQAAPVSATELAPEYLQAAAVATTQLPVSPSDDVAVEPDAPAAPRIDQPDLPVDAVVSAVLRPGDIVAYPTLAAAVAAQGQSARLTEELRCLAGAIYFESKGEPLTGQLAVAEVIINRAGSGRFPPDVCKVVTQPGQFGFVRGGRIPDIAENAAWRTAIAVAKVAIADAWDSPAARAMYFNTPNRVPAARLTKVAMIGNHVFYR